MIGTEEIKRRWMERNGIEDECQEYFWAFLDAYTPRELVRGLVAADLRDGVSPGMIQVRYDLTVSQVRSVQIKIGLRKPKYIPVNQD